MTINDLDEDIRAALMRGFHDPNADSSYVSDNDLAAAAEDPVELARLDGLRLAEACARLWDASVSEYRRDQRRYDEVAQEMDARYGDGLVVRSSEFGNAGQTPGFRA